MQRARKQRKPAKQGLASTSTGRGKRPGDGRFNTLLAENLERRVLLSAAVSGVPVWRVPTPPPSATDGSHGLSPTDSNGDTFTPDYVLKTDANGIVQAQTSAPTGVTPAQMRHAYGLDLITFGSVTGNGAGQTIAIIDAYDDPTIVSDLHNFDQAFGLPDPVLTKVAQDGSSNLPGTDPAGAGNDDWEIEESLDVEWTHAMAPAANIILVEASSPTDVNLLQDAANWARNDPGVAAISMSFSEPEADVSNQAADDAILTTPAGHTGVTFLASTGDSGEPSGFPAYSPNVVAVGGTTLNIDSSGDYISESGWSGSGGGISTVETQPAYQKGVVTQSSTYRTVPDVSFDADPNSGVPVYDSYDFGTSTPWLQVGGTSLSSPSWAGIIAVADQGRVLAGGAALDSSVFTGQGTLAKLYAASSSAFHDITTGNNGYAAGPGYDLVTGIGSPVAQVLIPNLLANFYVTGSTPSGPQASAISDVQFTFSKPVDESKFSLAADVDSFTGPAGSNLLSQISGYSFPTTSTLQINFTQQATEGVYALTIGPEILSASNDTPMDQNQNGIAGEPTDTYTAHFGYDPDPMTVTSITPANGSIATLPLTTITVTFSKPFDPTTVASSNLVVSEGTVTGASVINSTTAEYTLSGVTTDGPITASLAAGALLDANENPNIAYTDSFIGDLPTQAYPVPLNEQNPQGSLVFGSTTAPVNDGIYFAGDLHNYTISLDAGQTVTAVMHPTGTTLTTTLGLYSPSNTLLSSVTSAAGQDAMLQTVTAATAGTYTVRVTGTGTTTGQYTLDLLLNTALEASLHGGGTNTTFTTAQSISSSLIAVAGGQRGAVIGTLPSSSADNWYSLPLTAGDSLSLALAALGSGTATLRLYNASSAELAAGVATANSLGAINDFLVPTTGTYYFRVTGATTQYCLTAAHNVSFDSQPDNTIATALPVQSTTISGTQSVLGHIDTGSLQTTTYDELPEQSVDGLTYDGVSYGFTINGVHSPDAFFGSYGPGTTRYVSDPSLIALPGTLSLNFASPTSIVNFGLAIASVSAENDAATVQLYDANSTLIGTYPVNTSVQGYVYSEAEFNYSGTPVAQAIVTFNGTAAPEFALDNLQYTLGSAQDIYSINAAQGATLQLSTATPFGQGTGNPLNSLDPKINLYNASGTLLASDDNSGADGRNALLNFNVPAAGTYYVAVVPSPLTSPATTGDYTLSIAGNTQTPAAFAVSSTIPANNATYGRTTQIQVTFNQDVLLSSLAPSDLTVDGTAASAVTAVNGDTATFTLAASLADGLHHIAIAAGAVRDVQGAQIQAYAGQFTQDTTPPTVVSTSVQSGSAIPGAGLALTIQFSKPIETSNITDSSFSLVGATNGAQTPVSFSFNSAGTILTLNYSALPDDVYKLTLVADSADFTDTLGNILAGSGGVAGTNFALSFDTYTATQTFPKLLQEAPAGSLIYGNTDSGLISASLTEDFTLSLAAGQTLSVAVHSLATLEPSVSVIAPSGGTVLGTASASAVGSDALLQLLPITTTGIYTLQVSGVAGSAGFYTIQAVLNAAIQSSLHGAPANSTPATAQNIDGTFSSIGPTASRGAVVGQVNGIGGLGPDSYGYEAVSTTPSFTDVSSTGNAVLQGVDDGYVQLPSSQLGGFTFPFYGTNYSTLFVSSNGLITFGSGNSEFESANLTSDPTQAAIAPYWNDLVVGTGTGNAVYWQVEGSGSSRQLVLQWNNVTYIGSITPVTFEAVLSANGTIQFNYRNLTDPYSDLSNGAYAAVGIKNSGTQGGQRLLVSYDSAPNQYVGSDLSTVIGTNEFVTGTPQYYAMTVAANTQLTVGLSDQTVGSTAVELVNSAGTVLATGGATAADLSQVISNYDVTATGTYYVVVSGSNSTYGLVVTKNAVFDQEDGTTIGSPQALSGNHVALGNIISTNGVGTGDDFYSFTANAGDVIQLSTNTPGSQTSQLTNTLNPEIDLFSPGDALVATNEDSAADGRNALLTYTVPAGAGGTYTVDVRASGTIVQEQGLVAQFYTPGGAVTSIPNFSTISPEASQVDSTVNIPSSSGSTTFDGQSLTGNFAVQWNGLVDITTAGSTTFYVGSDDGSRLYVDGNLLIDNSGVHNFQTKSAAVTLSAGYHTLLLQYFQNTGADGMVLSYTPAGGTEQVIPGSVLTHNQNSATGTGGEYILNVNRLPVASAVSAATEQNTAVNINALASDSDPDGDALTLTAVGNPADGTATLNANGTITYVPATGFVGSDSFSYTIVDSDGGSSNGTVTVNVRPAAVPPVANAGPNQTVNEGAVVTFDGSGSSDPEGYPLTYSWNFGDNTTGTGIAPTHQFTTGVYTVTLTVNNGYYSSSATMQVTVLDVAPTVTITGAPVSSNEGIAITLGSTVTSPGTAVGDTFTYAWTIVLGSSTVYTAQAPGITFTPTLAGAYTASLVVTDHAGSTGSESVNIPVTHVPRTLSVTGASTVNEGSAYTLNLSSTSPSTAPITSWTINWGDGSTITYPGNPSSVTYVYVGGPNTYLVSGSATDSEGTYNFGPNNNPLSISTTTTAPTGNVVISQTAFNTTNNRDWRFQTGKYARDIGQTFTPANTFLLSQITLQVYSEGAGAPGQPYVLQLFAVNGYTGGAPTTAGTVLSSYNVILQQNGVLPATTSGQDTFMTFTIPDTIVQAGQQYGFLLSLNNQGTNNVVTFRTNPAFNYSGGAEIERMFGSGISTDNRTGAVITVGQFSGSNVYAPDEMVFWLQSASDVLVNVANVPPAVAAGSALTASVGTPMNSVESFTSFDPASTLTATVDYGDGSGPQILPLNANGTFDLNKTYSSSGSYTIIVRLTDSFGGVGVGTFNVTVSPAALPAWLSPSSAAQWNPATQILTVTGATTIIADPGSAEPVIQASGAAAQITINPASGLDIHLGGLSLSNGASATVTSLGAARTASNVRVLILGTPGAGTPIFSIDSTSRLDLTDNDLIDLYGGGTSPYTAIRASIKEAYDGGKWDLGGLASSVAAVNSSTYGLGYAEAASLGDSTFDGVTLGGNAVLVKYTLLGDTQLRGSVGIGDYDTVLNNFGTAQDWIGGDFHYGGVVSIGDYDNVLANFGKSISANVVLIPSSTVTGNPGVSPSAIAAASTGAATSGASGPSTIANNATPPLTGTVTTAPATRQPTTITLAKPPASFSADGTSDVTHWVKATVSGPRGVELAAPATLTYYAGRSATGKPLKSPPTTAGTYTVVAAFAGNSNYLPSEASITFVIEPPHALTKETAVNLRKA